MSDIIKALNTDVQSRIASYHTLAKKAVKNDDSPTGVFAALERFFYKLDFLLQYGRLPVTDDTKEGGTVPPELQKLQSFLEEKNTRETFVLQRNATERFCFSWQNNGKLTVTKEECHYAPAGVRAGYASAGEWRAHTIPQNVELGLMQQTFKFFTRVPFISSLGSGFYYDEKEKEMEDSTDRIPINERYFSTENKVPLELLSQRIDNTVEQIKGKKYSKTFFRKEEDIPEGPWFNSCIQDIARTKSISINGVELEQETFCKIKRAIYDNPNSSKVTQVNVSPLNEETISSILSDLKDKKTRDAVEPVLRSPQLIFAVLSGVSQSLALQFNVLTHGRSLFDLHGAKCIKKDGLNPNEQTQLENNFFDKNKATFNENYKINISMDNEQNLQCHLSWIFLTGVNLNKTDLIMEPYKIGLFYPVPRNFAQGIAQMDINSTLEEKLGELLPSMYARIATLE